MNNKIVVGITQGDSNGISYEVIIKALSDPRIMEMCTPVIYGSSRIFGIHKKNIPEMEGLSTNIVNSPKELHPKRINIINCIPDSLVAEPGKASSESARGAMLALETAVADLKKGEIDVLVTAPFNKASMNRDGFSFPGHTEYLAKEFGAQESLMFMVSPVLKVGLVTNHLPVKSIASSITSDLIIHKYKLMSESLRKDFGIDRPKIAVLSLNPHAGDEGLLGTEEEEIIKPAIKSLKHSGELAFGPYSPDGFFASPLMSKFDAVLAMYHDQGLIPFKALSFESGVNFTAGLPVVRTSPDHGTGHDIAGKNLASGASMLSAIYSAIDIFNKRLEYEEIRANPLKVETPVSRNNND